MCDKTEFELCRLCLNGRGLLINVFGENSKLQFMLEKTIEDLIDVKVVEDANYPWLVCSNCMEKLTEFRLFKRRCAECLFVFHNRIQKGCNPATKDWITNREEFSSEIKKNIDEDPIASHTVDSSAVDAQDGMIVVKEEVDTGSGCSVAPENDVELPMIASMQEGDSHWSGNDEAGNLDPLEDGELRFNEEVVIKEEWDVDIPQEEGCLGGDMLQEQDGGKRQDGVGNNLHTCQICKERFAQKDILEVHLMLLHPVKVEEIRCDVDAEAFDYTSDVEADAMKYKCAVCLRAFSEKGKLKRHMLTHTDEGGPEEEEFKCEMGLKDFHHQKQLVERRPLSGEKPYECQACAMTFALKRHLKDHVRLHVGDKLHKCEVCTKAFTKKVHLERHALIHSGIRPHKCEVCSKGFHEKEHLKCHMLTHTGERPHKCDVCLKTFTLKQSLKVHMYTHTGEKSFKCEVCSKAFAMKQHLTEHRLTHSGEKPHKCGVCSKAFSLKPNLKRHMFIHTGERPYKCVVCLKGFHQKQNLKRHMLTHSAKKPRKSEGCPKTSTLKHNRKDPINTRAGEKPQEGEVTCESIQA